MSGVMDKVCANVKKYKKIYLFLCVAILLIVIDQVIKIIVEHNMQVYDTIDIIPNILRITYLQNYGAAFSMLYGQTIFLIILTLVVIALLIGFVMKNKIQDIMYLIPITMIVSGGIGNLLDRLIRSYVVDYVDTTFWPLQNFAIFNFADCLVVVGAIILLVKLIMSEVIHKKDPKDSKGKEDGRN